MSELALQLIREAKEQHLTRLDLGNCGLTELPDELFELVWLEELNLSNNKSIPLKSLKKLQKIPKLKTLHIMDNNITDISLLAEFSELKSLSLDNNEITNILPLKRLTKLQLLGLSSNKIKDIKPLALLTQLEGLFLFNNKIVDITPLAGLLHLRNLDIDNNQINDINALTPLNKLHALHLTYNKIKDIKPLKELIKNNTHIYLIDPIEITEQEYNGRIITLFANPLKNPPKEVVEQGNEAILNYFKALDEQGSEPLNEAKLIIVGEPAAGKTTLMEILLNPNFQLSKQTVSTLGIEVREGWQFTNSHTSEAQFTANIWDFGGQQIQYMTHQFFLTPSALYVLVSANDRKEPTNFPYWFKIIHLLGEEQGRYSPVLVVLNEKDDKFINKFNFDRKFYEERYPELKIEVCEVDLSKRDVAYQFMLDTVQRMLSQLPHVTDPRPARWKDIRADLRECAQTINHISFADYAAICSRHEVTDEQSQLVFSRYLHKLGSLLHFSEDPSLYNFIILKPQWAVDAVYSVLNDNQVAKNDGYFDRAQVESIWQNQYTFDERCKLLSLMQKESFEICYPLDYQKDIFIAPQLLNVEQPHFIWNTIKNLRFRFQYKFMPEGIITRLIVRLNSKLACDENGKQLIWRRGAVFIDYDCRALVQEQENRDGLKIIDISINGDINERKYLLHQIINEIHDIHRKWFRNIQVEQMIPCVCSYCANPEHKDVKFFEYRVLKRALERGKDTVECDKEFLDVSVKYLLEGVFEHNEASQREKSSMTSNTYNIVANNSPFIIGDENTQKSHSDNITITINMLTTEQQQIMSSVLDELWEHRDQLDKHQRKTVRDLQDIIEVEVVAQTPETQSKLGKVWQELQSITDFTNNSLEIGTKVTEHWPAIMGWIVTAATYF